MNANLNHYQRLLLSDKTLTPHQLAGLVAAERAYKTKTRNSMKKNKSNAVALLERYAEELEATSTSQYGNDEVELTNGQAAKLLRKLLVDQSALKAVSEAAQRISSSLSVDLYITAERDELKAALAALAAQK